MKYDCFDGSNVNGKMKALLSWFWIEKNFCLKELVPKKYMSLKRTYITTLFLLNYSSEDVEGFVVDSNEDTVTFILKIDKIKIDKFV